jgi:MFS family permease
MHRRTLWTLYAGNLLTQIGVWFFIPLLPIFIARRGGSPALIGVVFAAGLLANALIRYPAGWAADRWGTRPVLLGAMAVWTVMFLAYLLPLPLPAFVVIRFLHGVAGGAYWPAANGLVAQLTPAGQRGRAFGVMQSTSMAGMLIGPGIGGFIALFNLSAVFIVSACMGVVATIALSRLPNVRAEAVREAQDYTWHTLQKAYRPGMGQMLPDRLFWAREDEPEPRVDDAAPPQSSNLHRH